MKRSPKCPSLSLQAAIEYVAKAYPKTARHKSDKITIARLFGYSSLNGASLTVIGALNQYGLLEGRRDAIGFSEDAESIVIEPENSQARFDAFERCSKNPAVFADVLSHFNEKLPADEIIRPYLIRKGFSPSSTDDVIRVLRENLDFVREESKRYTQEETGGIAGEDASDAAENEKRHTYQQPNMKTDTFNLDEGEVTLTWPKQLSKSSFEDFESWLKLILKRARRSAGVRLLSEQGDGAELGPGDEDYPHRP